MDNYTARPSGSVGHEILADGEVVAWTVGGLWAAVIVDLLERAEEGNPSLSAARRGADTLMQERGNLSPHA